MRRSSRGSTGHGHRTIRRHLAPCPVRERPKHEGHGFSRTRRHWSVRGTFLMLARGRQVEVRVVKRRSSSATHKDRIMRVNP